MYKNIRKFNLKEIDQIIEIWYQSNIDTHNFISKEHFQNIKEQVKNKFLKSNIYLYEENNIIKGFILINNDYIDELYVDIKFRNHGIGTKLLNYLKEEHNTLTLNVFQKNENAIRFYQKNGFQIIEENIEDYTKEKGYFMCWVKNENF